MTAARRMILIASNTFREAVRNKIFYTLIFFAIILSGLSVSLSTIIVGTYERIIIDMGLAIVEIIGTLIAIFVGITLVYKEIDKKTVYTIISRPIHRYEFVVGKFLGLWLTLFIEVLFMTGIIILLVSMWGAAKETVWILKGVSMIMVELTLVTATAIMFSSISTPILSGMFTLGFYLIGCISGYLNYLLDPDSPAWAQKVVYWLGFILPNFDILNYKGVVIHHVEVGLKSYMASLTYGISYTLILLTIGIMGFNHRDMK